MKYANNVLARLRRLFPVIHRQERMSEAGFQCALGRPRRKRVWTATNPAHTTHAENMAERFRQHGDACFRFITTPGIEPTNDLAEPAIRFVVIDRRIPQGARGERGWRCPSR
jgi:hypothetical protein